MNQYERITIDLTRVQARVPQWLDRYFPEFTTVFASWEGKTALYCLRVIPLPAEVSQYTAESIIALWRQNGLTQGVSAKRAFELCEQAQGSVGLKDAPKMAREELNLLLE